MQFQFNVASSANPAPPPPITPETVPDLLRQMLEVQREQLHHARVTAQDNLARWRQLLSRWQEDHPDFAGSCQKAYPLMEKAYVQMLVTLVEEIADQDGDALDGDFAVQEFLDRYGMKLGQLSHIISIIGPLSEAAHQQEEARKHQQQQGQ